MRFKSIYDAAQRHVLFVTNMDVGKGREQDAVSFARHSKDHQYSYSRAPRSRGAGTSAERSHINTDWYHNTQQSRELMEMQRNRWLNSRLIIAERIKII